MPRNFKDTLNALARRRGFYWPSYEIYGGQSGYVTYDDLGTRLKRNIEAHWRRHFIRRQNVLEIDAPIVNPETIFESSDHIANFKKHSTQCTRFHPSFRADPARAEIPRNLYHISIEAHDLLPTFGVISRAGGSYG